MADEQKAPQGPQVITSTVESTDDAVRQGRNEIPIGVGGAPIQRFPYNAQFAALLAAGTTTKRLAGQERCLQIVTLPLQGGTEGRFHCSLPCVSAGVDGEKHCPEHDREFFRPQQDHPPKNQRVFNSASIPLTEAERQIVFEKDGKKVVVDLEDGRDVGAARGRPQTVITPAAPVQAERKRARAPRGAAAPRRSASPKGGSLVIRLDVSELKSPAFIDVLREKLVEAINLLPARNIAEMEAVVAVRERVKTELQYQEEGK